MLNKSPSHLEQELLLVVQQRERIHTLVSKKFLPSFQPQKIFIIINSQAIH